MLTQVSSIATPTTHWAVQLPLLGLEDGSCTLRCPSCFYDQTITTERAAQCCELRTPVRCKHCRAHHLIPSQKGSAR